MLQTRHITASLLRRGVGICAVRSRRVGTTDGAGASVDDRSVPTEFKNVFADKPTSEIVRALFVFKMCTYDVFVRNSLQLMTIGERLAGRRLFMWTMRRTFYGQFVGGETAAEIEACKAALESAGVRAIMCVPIEEDTDAHM
ncbi:HYPDH-like protein [Mya arenaria]|uniref:Proline dehydrogenase n=1 Tax=Mya arenaria TaxID=6604 RepID=A0ABY7G111_MYAAR|nr:HYPDH-like protein [Mya arenaria]